MLVYEMHQHSTPCSACAKSNPAEAVRGVCQAGFSGVVITEHFYHGNSGIDRSLPWKAFVDAYEAAFLQAKEEGDRLGIDVIFGVEEVVDWGKEVLIYGLAPDFFRDHPEWAEMTVGEEYLAHVSQCVHRAGGLVYQAHPHRSRPYVVNPDIPLNHRYLDGIELFNASNRPFENEMALTLAKKTQLPLICGSDAHAGDFGSGRCGITVDRKIGSEKELCRVLRQRQYGLYIPQQYEFLEKAVCL